MPVTPLGNTHFVNQNVSLVSTQVSNEVAKESFASMANLAEFQAKEKDIEKLEKVQQSDEVKEEIKEKADEEEAKKNKQDRKQGENENTKEETSEEQELSAHRLDISI